MPRADLRPLIGVTAAIVEAYAANNRLPAGTLPQLIEAVHEALCSLRAAWPAVEVRPEQPTPGQIRRSITPEALISFIDGKSYKTLKRHLTAHGLTPVSYRERYGLPRDYPMVAPAYGDQRSRIAKAIGLGLPRLDA
ncbi:MucR family transcriptional regulator [Methylobacterium nigriterrae]|uniref:MucR family transcriptional regulator n=1 Tax=Methylobacterium nigriterrae TaxID=3127512 RepID=UPI003013BA7B